MASESIPRRGGMKTTRLLALNEGGSAMYGIILDINLRATARSGITVQLPVQFSGVREAQSPCNLCRALRGGRRCRKTTLLGDFGQG
jgi:hypothetical protein